MFYKLNFMTLEFAYFLGGKLMSLIKSKKIWPAFFLIAIFLTLNISILENSQILTDEIDREQLGGQRKRFFINTNSPVLSHWSDI